MLERPSNIFERFQKCYKTFKRLITCYNELYANVRRCANRSNILYITCCITCCVTCLNGLPRAIVNDSNPLTISTKDSILDVCFSVRKRSFIQYICKIYRETNICYPLTRARTCAYKEVRNVSFSENFVYSLNE